MWTNLLKSVLKFLWGSSNTGTSQESPPLQQHPYQVPPGQWHTSNPPDANQFNQSHERYQSLRVQANEHGDQMARCFEQSHNAYSQGDGALAKDLSNQGKEHQRKMEALNREASNQIFIENNKDSKPGEIDLHGLYVKEAISHADQAIQDARRRGDTRIMFIVGKGLHSQGGVAKIKPAIEDLIRKHSLTAALDPDNAGVLIVQLNTVGDQRGLGAEEISRRLERNDNCTIM